MQPMAHIIKKCKQQLKSKLLNKILSLSMHSDTEKAEMILKYRGFTIDTQPMWNVKMKVILVIIMVVVPMSESLRK